MRGLAGKFALVTGAGGSGVGRGVAVRLAQEGVHVAVHYGTNRTGAEETGALAQEAARAAGHADARALLVQGDMAEEGDILAMFTAVLADFGRLDILINNAGFQTSSPTHETSTESFDAVLAVNLRGYWLCCREAIRHFLSREGGGVIVNDSSVHQIVPKPQYLSYAITKAGIGHMTRTLALEYADRNIRVNAVGPGAIVTPINRAWIDDTNKRANVESHIPMGRAGTIAEMGAVFAFLASDEASYITGQTLFACGGLTLYPEFRTDWASG